MRLCIFFSSTHLVSSCLNRAFIWASECTGSPYWLFIITLTFGLWVNLLNRVSLGNNLSKDSAKTMRSQIKTFKAWSPLNKQCENSITLFFCRSLQNSIRCYKREILLRQILWSYKLPVDFNARSCRRRQNTLTYS